MMLSHLTTPSGVPPKNPEFKKHFGPRGVIHSYADGRIEDTDPLTIKRMETVDEEFLAAALEGGEPMTEEKNYDPDGMYMCAKCVR